MASALRSSSLSDLKLGLGNVFKVRGLSVQKKMGYTFALFLVFAGIYVFLDAWGAAIVLTVGLWAIWNGNNDITPNEKRWFATAIVIAVMLSLVDYASILLKAAGLFLLLGVAAIAVIWWPRKGRGSK